MSPILCGIDQWAQSKMADSELHMECEEGDLAPWQHATDEEGEELGMKMGGSERPGEGGIDWFCCCLLMSDCCCVSTVRELCFCIL